MSDIVPVVTEVYQVDQVVMVDGSLGRVVGRKYDAAGKTTAILIDFGAGTNDIPYIEAIPAARIKEHG